MLSKNNKGVISLYLCMLFSIMLSVTIALIGYARVSASKQKVEQVVDMGMDSALAEFEQTLLDRYGLLFIDTSYGEARGSTEKLVNHMKDYMDYNLEETKDLVISGRNFLGLKIKNIDVITVSRATDNYGDVFKYMALSYMRQHYGYSYVENASNLSRVSESSGFYKSNIDSKFDSASKEIDSIDFSVLEKIKNVAFKDIDTSNPVGTANENRRKGILKNVCKKSISKKTFNKDTYASKRDLVKGNGLYDKWNNSNELADEFLFSEYVLLKAGNYVDQIDNSLLDYEAEYVIAGSNNDTENLRKVVEKILLIRGGSNLMYYYTDSSLKAKVKEYALGLSVVSINPELYEVYKTAIELAWVYGESVNDVRILLDGGKIPLIKSKGDWNTSLSEALKASFGKGSESKNSKGQDYKDYLRLLLYTMDSKDKVIRMMDVVEMDVRKITDQQSFALDNCVAAFAIQAIFESNYGKEYLITRSCSYW